MLPLLLPPTRHEPSEATDTDRMGTSSSGSCSDISRDSSRGASTIYEFVRALVPLQIPDFDGARLIARDQFALIRMNDTVVYW